MFNFNIILALIMILDFDLPNISPLDTFASKNVNKNPQKPSTKTKIIRENNHKAR